MQLTHRQQTALALAAGAVLLLPLFMGSPPPLGDYPNHMARLWILLHPESWLRTTGLIELNPHLTPNLGFEMVALALGRVLPFEAVGPATIGIILLTFLAGTLLVARAVAPQQWGYGALVGFFGWHFGLQAGFLSYSLAVGLFLLVFGCWLHWTRGHGTGWGVAAALVGVPLALVHATGPVLFGIAVAFALAGRLVRRDITLTQAFWYAAPIVPACIGFLLLRSPSPEGVGHSFAWNSIGGKVAALASWARSYDLPFDIVWVIALALVVVLIARGTTRAPWDNDVLMASLGLWLVTLAAPLAVMTGTGVDRRFVPPAFTLLALSFIPALVSARPRMIVALAMLLLVRQGAIAVRWQQFSYETAAVVTLLAKLPPDAMLLQCSAEADYSAAAEKRRMVFRHVGHFITPLRGGVSSTLFGFEGQQPIIVDGARLNRAAGAESGSCREPSWPYLLVEEGAPTVLDSRYAPLGATGRWSLWRRIG